MCVTSIKQIEKERYKDKHEEERIENTKSSFNAVIDEVEDACEYAGEMQCEK